MKAAVLHGTYDIRIEDVTDPVVEPDGIIIKVKMCGICGTDLHVYKLGGMNGVILGHEFSGVVAEIGNRVTDISVGDRITASCFQTCGHCPQCKENKFDLCPNIVSLGYQIPGAMAAYVSIPLAKLGQNVFKIPGELTDEDGATIEPLAISTYAIDKAQPKENDKVVVMGLGVIGLNMIQILKAKQISSVLAAGRRPSRLAAAKASGADLVVDATRTDALASVMEATAGIGADMVIECAGSQDAFTAATEMVRVGGKIMLVALHEQPIVWNTFRCINKNIALIGCTGANFSGAVKLLQEGKVRTKSFVTHSFPLNNVNEAFQAQIKDQQAIKIMIKL